MAAREQTPFAYQLELAALLDTGADVVIGKARQIGCTEVLCHYARYRVEQGQRVLALSKGLREAEDLLERTEAAGLPSAFKANTQQVRIGNGGVIRALPATKDAGRSFTADLVLVDEAAFHPWAQDNYKAYRPTMADVGQLVIVSTGNGPSGFFYEMFTAAREGRNGFVWRFYSAEERPRPDGWYERERTAYEGLPGGFTQENPRTIDEMFVAHSGLVYGMDPDDATNIFDRRRNVGDAKTGWADCAWRVVGFDPGGRDPNALIPVGVDGSDRAGVYGEFYRRGLPTLEQIDDYLARLESAGHIHAIPVDPSAKGWVVALQSRGWPAFEADNDRGAGIAAVRTWLKSGRLTISPNARNLLTEFDSYWWADRSDGMSGGKAVETKTPAHHHGDGLDALRYAILSLQQGRLAPGFVERRLQYA